MVLILDGKSEIGVHIMSNLCYLVSLRHLIRSRTNSKSINGKMFLLHKANQKDENISIIGEKIFRKA